MKTGLITTDTYQNHDTGNGHPEKIDRVSVVIDNFKKLNNQNLIWEKPKKFDLNQAFAIASHPQALGQCSKWIERNIGSIKRLEMPSSAAAAKYAKENKNILCIVNSLAVENYKLKSENKNRTALKEI